MRTRIRQIFAATIVSLQLSFIACQAQTTAQPDTQKATSVGLGIDSKKNSYVSEQFSKDVEKFQIKLTAQKRSLSSNNASGPLRYLIEKERFLGEPVLARLPMSGDKKRTNYLVVFHYNIPTIRTTWLPTKYGFVRFSSRMALTKEGNDGKDQYGKVDLISIYPSNELLDVEHADKNTNTLHVEPKYMNTSAGSFEHQTESSDSYKFQLPKVIGTSTRLGECSWTYYPAKLQPLILGSKTSIAVISVPNNYRTLDMQFTLCYQLKSLKVMPLRFRVLRDALQFNLTEALDIDELLAIHSLDLPDNIVEKLKGKLSGHATYTITPMSINGDYFSDDSSGQYYRVTKDKSEALFPEKN